MSFKPPKVQNRLNLIKLRNVSSSLPKRSCISLNTSCKLMLFQALADPAKLPEQGATEAQSLPHFDHVFRGPGSCQVLKGAR